ncbi:RNA 2',3'-cyclic phosphodiesterase [Dyella sp. C9]|uniref:RNA 2',3'-cyclic phosphodiesterase n=1 Tax=Dyella sp. C9 TaxID=2202154 RepID=UPI000DEF7447|nr:RNA 2',3'-cyclic phosphodiesterase [Dyella sp. C9]
MPRSSHSPGSQQLDLLGGGQPAQIHRLFFALLPDDAVARQIETAAAAAALAQQLRARMIRPSRYHLTLHFLGDHPQLRTDIVNAAIDAAGKVRGGPFELLLDSASAFHGREPPCVLRCEQTPAALQTLWQDLRHALTLAGAGMHVSRSFTPHVTYAYSRSALPQAVAIEPVCWRVDGFALLHSVVGGGEYRILDRWRL